MTLKIVTATIIITKKFIHSFKHKLTKIQRVNKSKVFPILITKGKEILANLKEESHPGLQDKDAI